MSSRLDSFMILSAEFQYTIRRTVPSQRIGLPQPGSGRNGRPLSHGRTGRMT